MLLYYYLYYYYLYLVMIMKQELMINLNKMEFINYLFIFYNFYIYLFLLILYLNIIKILFLCLYYINNFIFVIFGLNNFHRLYNFNLRQLIQLKVYNHKELFILILILLYLRELYFLIIFVGLLEFILCYHYFYY